MPDYSYLPTSHHPQSPPRGAITTAWRHTPSAERAPTTRCNFNKMPRRFIQPDLSGYKIEALAIVISAIAYGIVLMLFFNTFWLVVRTKEQHMRKLLLGYICVMVSLSTGAMVQEIIFMMRDVLPKTTEDARSSMADLSSLRGIPLSFPFTTWGADGVLVSRPFNLIICSHWDLLKV